MGYKNIESNFHNNNKRLSLYFFLLFFVFSLIISTIGYVVSQYILTKETNHRIEENIHNTLEQKKTLIKNFIDAQHYYLDAVINNELFYNYVKDTNQYNNQVQKVFLSIAKTSPSIMQLRFINKEGLEKIRVTRDNSLDTPHLTKKDQLQNKSTRYYFKDVAKLKNKNDIWFSKIDLNVEHGEIQKPIVPTIRVAKPIIIDNKFSGMVIINIFAKEFLNNVTKSLNFQIGILNNKKEYLMHYNDPQKSWSEFFKDRSSFSDEYCIVDTKHIEQNKPEPKEFFTKYIEDLIPNNPIYLILTPYKTAIDEIKAIQKQYILYFILFTLFISIPISILLSRVPFNYTKKLIDSKHQLLNIIDEHVLYSSSDLDGNITDVANAVCKLTKYSKQELIGKNHNIFRHPDSSDDAFTSMWNTIQSGNTWCGELKNLNKNGEVFWISATITPNYNDNGEISGFTAIRENITDKKIIEALSITDELTTLYNKRYFNKTFPKELKRAKRIKTNFVFVILDVDNFKLYNDTYGHKDGDEVLQEIGVLLRKMFKRSYDYAFRIGGEEFAIIFFEKEIDKILPYLDNVRKSIHDLNIEHEHNGDQKVITVSIGYKVIDVKETISEEDIYTQADQALYFAKQNGRNQVINYDEIKNKL